MLGDPDYFPPTLLYNHTMVPLTEEFLEKLAEDKKVPAVPFNDDDVLVDGGRYKDRRGLIVTMIQRSPDALESKVGYSFRSDRGVSYKPNGATMDNRNKMFLDDIVERVV